MDIRSPFPLTASSPNPVGVESEGVKALNVGEDTVEGMMHGGGHPSTEGGSEIGTWMPPAFDVSIQSDATV